MTLSRSEVESARSRCHENDATTIWQDGYVEGQKHSKAECEELHCHLLRMSEEREALREDFGIKFVTLRAITQATIDALCERTLERDILLKRLDKNQTL